MNQNGRVIFFECLRPKLAIFEVKPSIHSVAYVTIARTHSKTIVRKFFQEKKNLRRKLYKFNKSDCLDFRNQYGSFYLKTVKLSR